MIDAHVHLDFSQFDKDRNEVIQRAFDNGVEKIINVGCSIESSEASVVLAEKYENIFASIGVHPHNVGNMEDKDIDDLRSLIKMHKKIIAVGEIGLDYFKSMTPKDVQIKWFKKQIELAQELNLPVIIHCRDAHQDVRNILNSYFLIRNSELKGVIHCFSGSLDDAEFYTNLGFYISFTGVITYTDEYDEVIKNIPLDKILVETDCPFLAPAPMRGKRNEPFFVRYVVQKIANIQNISIKEVEKETTANAKKLFAL